MLLIRNNTINDPAAPWNDWFNPVQAVFSVLNLAVFAFSLYEAWRLAFPDGLRKAPQSQEMCIRDSAAGIPHPWQRNRRFRAPSRNFPHNKVALESSAFSGRLFFLRLSGKCGIMSVDSLKG